MSATDFKEIFPFFDIPQGMRDLIYGHLTKIGPVFAMIKPPLNAESAKMTFQNMWLTPLLLVNKQFGEEYFDQVCERRLLCTTTLGSKSNIAVEDAGLVLQGNPGSALKALTKACVLMAIDELSKKEHLATFTNLLPGILPSLMALMPNLQTYEKSLCISSPTLTTSLAENDLSFLHAIHTHYPSGAQKKKQQQQTFLALLAELGNVREIQYVPELVVSSCLSRDIVTRQCSPKACIAFDAVPVRFDPEGRHERPWFGMELRPTVMVDEEGKFRGF